MISLSTLINDDSFLKSIYGQSTLIHLPIGEVEGGGTGRMYGRATEQESSEKSILSKADFVSTRLFTNLITSEPTGCGVEERLLQEKMKNAMQNFLTKLQEDLFANLEKSNQGLNYEQKTAQKGKTRIGGYSVIDMRGC